MCSFSLSLSLSLSLFPAPLYALSQFQSHVSHETNQTLSNKRTLSLATNISDASLPPPPLSGCDYDKQLHTILPEYSQHPIMYVRAGCFQQHFSSTNISEQKETKIARRV